MVSVRDCCHAATRRTLRTMTFSENFIDSITPVAVQLLPGGSLDCHHEAQIRNETRRLKVEAGRRDIYDLCANIVSDLNRRCKSLTDTALLDWLVALSTISVCVARDAGITRDLDVSLAVAVTVFARRYHSDGNPVDADAAIRYVMELIPPPSTADGWERLLNGLLDDIRYWSVRRPERSDIDREIGLLSFMSLRLGGVEVRAAHSLALSKCLAIRYQRFRVMDDLKRSMSSAVSTANLTGSDTLRSEAYDVAADLLYLQFHEDDSPTTLDAWIRAADAALRYANDDDTIARFKYKLAIPTIIRYGNTSERSDIDGAIRLMYESLDPTNQDEDTVNHLYILGRALIERASSFGRNTDLSRYTMMMDIVSNDESHNPGTAVQLATIGTEAEHRYRKSNALYDVDMAVHWTRRALAQCSRDAERGMYHSRLADLLWLRFEASNSSNDLDEHISNLEYTISYTVGSEIANNYEKKLVRARTIRAERDEDLPF